ncbi:MAG TPA: molybdenum cofactor guanylyltransferase [Thermoanaerobaculia bacterium]|nr:molybdenum cofactor guanylyltransferase [Thermoanaerobaculia bacterium]
MVPRTIGVVLAGGASTRMGRDKALLEIEGESLVVRAARRLGEVCSEVLVADAGRGLLPGSVPDGSGKGPAAGILGAALVRPGQPLLVLAVDLPRVPVPLLEELARSDADLAVPRWSGGVEPLCALYGPAALAALEERVKLGRFDLRTLPETPGLRVRWVEEIERFGEPAEVFLNVNRPSDLPG